MPFFFLILSSVLNTFLFLFPPTHLLALTSLFLLHFSSQNRGKEKWKVKRDRFRVQVNFWEGRGSLRARSSSIHSETREREQLPILKIVHASIFKKATYYHLLSVHNYLIAVKNIKNTLGKTERPEALGITWSIKVPVFWLFPIYFQDPMKIIIESHLVTCLGLPTVFPRK